MNSSLVRKFFACLFCWGAIAAVAAAPWFPLGPFGGDARAFAVDFHDSKHLYLGTATGWLYESHDGGSDWARLSQIAKRDDLVIKQILVDPNDANRLIVGAFFIDRPDGGLYISEDGGKSWYDQAQMRGQSVRSLARSVSNPKEVVAGTLQGIYRSNDNGVHWHSISPVGSTELHEVESIAIDPRDGNVIYAGTWHLPWKTMDGGANWENIKEGIIDDSDVFSIIIDPTRPNVVYASACSGIYKSVTAAMPNPRDDGKRFDKVQGIPSSARRTRKLMQDPTDLETVYAGTTQGLYRTRDDGKQWTRLTGGDVIVNDVFVDPRNSDHLLLATDRGGVLSSDDGGASFHDSNNGFSTRQISSYAGDARNAATLYVGVVNDKDYGGVFESNDGGIRWQQRSAGLGGRDVFSLLSMSDGKVLAGTGHGIFRLETGVWEDSSKLEVPVVVASPKPVVKALARTVIKPVTKTAKVRTGGKKVAGKSRVMVVKKAVKKPAPKVVVTAEPVPEPPAPPTRLDAVIYTMVQQEGTVYVGTSDGLLSAADGGRTWSRVTSLSMPEARFVAAEKKSVLVGSLRRLMLSLDEGATWDVVALPKDLTQIASVAMDELNNLWVGGREGVYYSTDYGETWHTLRNLFVTEVDGVFFDRAVHRVIVSSSNSTFAFAVHLPDYAVSYWDTGWKLRFARPVGDHLVGATLFDGMVVQPRMVDSAVKK